MTDTPEALPPLPEQLAATFIGYVEGLLGVCRVPSHVFEAFEQRADEFRAALTAAPSAQEPDHDLAAAWKSGARLQYLVITGHDDDWTDYTGMMPPDLQSSRLAWRIAPGAAPSAQAEPALRDKIGDLLAIGSAARTDEVILTNLGNLQRRAACLSAVEREFFTRKVPGEDEDEPGEECDLNWGAEPGEYVEQFRAVLAAPPAAQAEPTEGNWISADDYYRNVRALDVALNGEEGAAKRPLLIDVLSQVQAEVRRLGRPLLAAQAEPQEPLTDEQIENACAQIFLSDHGGKGTMSYDRAIARAIEAAHGIGKQEGTTP